MKEAIIYLLFDNWCNSGHEPEVIESWKKALHYAKVYGDNTWFRLFDIDTDGSDRDIKAHEKEYKAKYIAWYKKNILKIGDIENEMKIG